MNLNESPFLEKTVAEIVTDNYRTADTFRRHQIDFCCGGKQNLLKVCNDKSLDPQQIVAELQEQVNLPADSGTDFNLYSLKDLINHIISTHHEYVMESIPTLLTYADKVARVHGDRHPELIQIKSLLQSIFMELTDHMQKEEQVLFPYTVALESAYLNQSLLPSIPFGNFQNPISKMEDEHEKVGDLTGHVRRLASDFVPPEGACNTYRVFFAKLEEFERDLHTHVHLENNILFPRALHMDNELRGMR